MDVLVASLADDQRLAAARCHPLDPERFFALPRSAQISQLANVVDLKRSLLRFAHLAFLSQKALHDFATKTAVHHLGLVFERCVLLPSQFSLRLPRSRYRPRTVSALCITHTFQFGLSSRLFPFAMWQAFPASDYYGNSVALGVAPCRRSRVPSALNVASAR
jgi:hypothetical protein